MNTRSRILTVLAAASLLSLGAMAADAPAKSAKPQKIEKPEIRCESSASRIRRNKVEDCARSTQPTTNYYESDLQRTGQTDTGKGLRELDPRFQ